MDAHVLTTLRFPERVPAPSPVSTAAAGDLVLCTGELAECTCPDFCERDHANE